MVEVLLEGGAGHQNVIQINKDEGKVMDVCKILSLIDLTKSKRRDQQRSNFKFTPIGFYCGTQHPTHPLSPKLIVKCSSAMHPPKLGQTIK